MSNRYLTAITVSGNGFIRRKSNGAFPSEVQRGHEEFVDDIVQLGDTQLRQEQLTVTGGQAAQATAV